MVTEHALKKIFISAVISCMCMASSQAVAVEKATSAPKKAVPAPVVPKSPVTERVPVSIPPQPELNAAIEKIFLKGNRVFVLLAGTGSIIPENYSKIILRLETSRGPRQWSLAETDKSKILGTGRGKVEFDTGILLDKPEMVKGVLVFGKIEKPRQEMLVIAPAPESKSVPLTAKPSGTMATQIIRPRGMPPSPTLMLYDIGIRITPPVSSASYYQGEPISVRYEWTHSSAPAGNIEFGLENLDMSENYAAVTVPAARSGSIVLNPPATLRPQRYTVVGFNRDTGAFGRSDVFEVNRNSARIDFLSPAAGAVFYPGETITVRYKLNRRVEPGNIAFLFGSEGRVGRINRSYTPPSATTDPLPEYSFSFRVPDSTPVGEYGTLALHRTATGVGPAFSVAHHTFGDGGGEETVFRDCDYGIESVTFGDGTGLDRGVSVGSGPEIAGVFRVRMRWNERRIPATYPPGTVFRYEVRVFSAVTGQRIVVARDSGLFEYRTDATFDLRMPFVIHKDDIPRMSRDRFVPLRFTLERFGASIDANPANNLLNADMRVIGVTVNDIAVDLAEFFLDRRAHAGPLDDYTITQRVKVKNLSRSEMGGAPSPLNVKVKWCIDRSDSGTFGDGCGWEFGNITVENVRDEWVSRTFTGTFSERSPGDIPSGRRFRVKVTADPDYELVDPDRRSNVDAVTFGIGRGSPGAGSGVVIED